jgi:hypothetical protein
MANVPATFPVMPVNGYIISGMLTRGEKLGGRCSLRPEAFRGGRRRRSLSPRHEG